ncbi:hypothetical protein EG833_02565, partial [archaeon]|nr:hypothetical protein [archaeon]
MMKGTNNRFQAVIIIFFCMLVLNNCRGTEDSSWRYDPGIPEQVTGLNAESGNQVVTLNWDGNPIATSYNIYIFTVQPEDGAAVFPETVLNVTTTSKAIFGLQN